MCMYVINPRELMILRVPDKTGKGNLVRRWLLPNSEGPASISTFTFNAVYRTAGLTIPGEIGRKAFDFLKVLESINTAELVTQFRVSKADVQTLNMWKRIYNEDLREYKKLENEKEKGRQQRIEEQQKTLWDKWVTDKRGPNPNNIWDGITAKINREEAERATVAAPPNRSFDGQLFHDILLELVKFSSFEIPPEQIVERAFEFMDAVEKRRQ